MTFGNDALMAVLTVMGAVVLPIYVGLCLGLMLKAGWRGAKLALALPPLAILLVRLVPAVGAAGALNPAFVLAQGVAMLLTGVPLAALLLLPWRR